MPRYVSGQELSWKRFWTPWNSSIRCGFDGRGFLDDPEDGWGKYSNPQLRSLEELIEKRCVILSGHPGIGKTVAVETCCRRLKESCQKPDEIFFFHCRAVGSTEMLRTQTVGHPRWQQAKQAGGNITLIIDGVDEGLRKVPEFVASLTLLLREEPVSRLRLLVVCRSAEWDISAGTELLQLWPENERAGVYELCPLRYRDVEEAAGASGLDAGKFMKAVFNKQVQGLAARPITLQMLLEEFRQAHGFPRSRKSLFDRSMVRMCKETDEDRLKSLRHHFKPPPEKHIFRTVCRIAAVLMLCGKSIVLRRDEETPTETELPWTSFVGGNETVEGESFEVTKDLIEAALETAHFSFRGAHRYGFDHQTFAELMAANYLLELPLVQLEQLFCRRLGNNKLIAPQLSEVAAWLATEHKEWAQYLIQNQPTVLLRTDVSGLSNEQKEQAVRYLLEKAEAGQAFDDENISTYYRTLKHPKLASQLRPVIKDRGRSFVARRMAIEIAGDTNLRELEPELWKLLERGDPAHVPITHALRDLAGQHSKENLMRALKGEFPNDVNKDLMGIAIHCLVQDILPVWRVLPFIAETRNESHYGSYHSALVIHLPESINIKDVPAILEKMIDWKDCFSTLSPLHRIAERTFDLALKNLQHRKIASLTVRMWLRKTKTSAPLPGIAGDVSREVVGFADSKLRRDFVRLLLNSPLTTKDDFLHGEYRLLSAEDFGWLLQELIDAPRQRKELWAQVVAGWIWAGDRIKYRDLLLQAYSLAPELQRTLPPLKKGDILVTLDRYQKAQILRRQRREAKWKAQSKRRSRRQLLDDALHVLRTINATGWVGLSDFVYIEEGDDSSHKARQSCFAL